MPDEEHRQADLFSTRVERFVDSTRSAMADHLAEFDRRLGASISTLKAELKAAREEIERHERAYATRFNVFAYIEPDENRLSDILASLLGPKGPHGQGDRFLRFLMEQVGIANQLESRTVKVFREEPTAYLANRLRRIDILVDLGTFGIGIENKPRAGDQYRQVQDYLGHLERRYGRNFLLIYLSGSGTEPTSLESEERSRREGLNQFRLLDYRGGLVSWLDACLAECEADTVRWFLNNFRSYVLEQFSPCVTGEGE